MDCTICGEKPGNCYLQCPNSPGYYSPEQEREDALAFDSLSNAEVFAMQMREAGEDDLGEPDDYQDEIDSQIEAEELRIADEPMPWEDDCYAAQYDDDPNPYLGTYSEE